MRLCWFKENSKRHVVEVEYAKESDDVNDEGGDDIKELMKLTHETQQATRDLEAELVKVQQQMTSLLHQKDESCSPPSSPFKSVMTERQRVPSIVIHNEDSIDSLADSGISDEQGPTATTPRQDQSKSPSPISILDTDEDGLMPDDCSEGFNH